MSTIKIDTIEDLSAGESVDVTYVVHGTAKAYGRDTYGGGIPTIGGISLNVSSVTDVSTGRRKYNFANVMADNGFTGSGCGGGSGFHMLEAYNVAYYEWSVVSDGGGYADYPGSAVVHGGELA